MAHIRPEQIRAIHCHLTATLADPYEVANWHQALGLAPEKMPLLHSTKSQIGHALGAAALLGERFQRRQPSSRVSFGHLRSI